MAFSESFGLGNSTFMNLESEVNKALHRNPTKPQITKANPGNNPMDIIDESPTNSKRKPNTSRSRHYVSQLGANRRKNFRKSKSDSTLGERTSNANHAGASRGENYSEFFQSEFSIEMEPSKISKPVSFVSISRVEAAFQSVAGQHPGNGDAQDDFGFEESKMFSEMIGDIKRELSHREGRESSSELDAPVFSEDIREIFNSSTPEKDFDFEDGGLSSEEWKESLKFSEFQESKENVECDDRSLNEPEEVLNIDDCTFICADDTGREFADRTLNEIKCDVSQVLHEEEDLEVSKSKKTSNVYAPNESVLQPLSEIPAEISNRTQSDAEQVSREPYKLKRDLEDLKRISAWNLPVAVVKEYEKKGINKMFDWQIECLSNPKVLFEHSNLVYSAPTSAGKTLVSEILLIKTILERGKKVIVILPFISVVREKMFYLQDLLTPSGYRVEGFFGGYTPPGGFESIHVAICTIEKANSIVNKLLEQGKLDNIGTVVVDEIHLISDPGRGYILELLLAKVLYMSMKYAMQIQIITMSATLANVELLKKWLKAELYITNYRPVALQEMIKVGTKIFDNNLQFVRDINPSEFAAITDQDHVAQLCIETIVEGCSVVVFCPSKDWCENLSVQLAGAIHAVGRSGSEVGNELRANIKRDAIEEVKKQLKDIPTGLDSVLEKTINYACAFHHAGLTTEERDIIEACFKSGALKIIVATSTLSSGVNLPARRVIIRSPLFGGKQMSSLTYKQMIGRAGRTGKDTLGESILICTESNARIGKDLVGAALKPISSCLDMENSTHLKRALLEVISSGVATTKTDIENFVKCTLLSSQKELNEQASADGDCEGASASCSFIFESIDFLVEYEFIRLQNNDENAEVNYVATRLGMACLASSMPPTDGLILFSELQKSRRCFVLESELHAVYLVTPYSVCYQLQDLDWLLYLDLWEKLTPAMKKVGELVGVKESFLVRAMRGQTKLDYKLMQIHKRFYTALALQELVNETPVNTVAAKYKCTRGMLQSLQQMASTFAGIVTAFCNSLNWSMLSLIVGQFKERLFFGVHRDLIDLLRLPDLNYKRARALFDAGIQSLVDLANSDAFTVEKILHNSLSFDTAKKLENENEYEANQRNNLRNLYITGKVGLTVKEAATLLIRDARQFVEYEIGVGNINWSQEGHKLGQSNEASQLQLSSGERSSKRRSSLDLSDASPPKIKKIEDKGGIDQTSEKSCEDNGSKANVKSGTGNNQNVGNLKTEKNDAKQRPRNGESEAKSDVIEKVGSAVRSCARRSGSKDKVHQRNSPATKEVQTDLKPNGSLTNRAMWKPEDHGNKAAPKDLKSGKDVPQNLKNLKNTKLDSPQENGGPSPAFPINREKPVKMQPLPKDSRERRQENGYTTAGPTLTSSKHVGGNNAQCAKATNYTDSKRSENNPQSKAENLCSSDQKNNKIPHSDKENIPRKNLETGRPPNAHEKVSQSKDMQPPNDLIKPVEQVRQGKDKQSSNDLKKLEKAKESPQQGRPSKVSNDPTTVRRSPRNHLPSSTRIQSSSSSSKAPPRSPEKAESFHNQNLPSSTRIEHPSSSNKAVSPDNDDLFMDDTSFEMNSAIANAMVDANKHAKPPEPRKSLNKSSDEIAASQEMTFQPKTQSTRLLRSYKERTQNTGRSSPKRTPLRKKSESRSPPAPSVKPEITTKSASIEMSDISLGNSLIQNPIQLNSSHILSTSKTEPDALSLKCIHIVDICGSQMLFKNAIKELNVAEKLGFSVAIEKQASKRKPLIGANLLINQVGGGDERNEAENDFAINDSSYVSGVSMVMSENVAFYMNLQSENTAKGLTREMKISALRKIVENAEMTLQIFDAKEQLKILRRVIPEIDDVRCKLEDPKVANWLLQPDSSLSLANMAQQFAPECKALVKLSGSGRSHGSIGMDATSAIFGKIRASIEACATMHIIKGQIENLERIGKGQLQKFFSDLEMPLQLSLCNMEMYGFPANEDSLRNLYQKMLDAMKKLETKIYEAHGSRFNLGSSSAVGRVLGLHRKANGRVSTSRQILEKIDSPIAQMIIVYRKLSFTCSTIIQPLMHCVVGNRIRGQSITYTPTGRISMHEPNLQNVAKDFEVAIGKSEKINISCRSSFFPPKGRCLVSADFCQLEMRILAHLSQDPQLVQVMNSEKDLFTAIAAKWNKVPEDSVSEQLRNGTKQICYGIVYGMGMRTLAESLKCNEQEAMSVSEQFHAAYPGIRLYAEKVIKFARQHGYIETITGRRRYLDNINSGEQQLKSQAERQAVNSAIQGSAADIAKTAILRMEKNLAKYQEKMGLTKDCVHFVLHLHDELLFEVPEDKAKKVAKVLSITMENCVRLSIPLKVKVKTGRSWGELEEVRF